MPLSIAKKLCLSLSTAVLLATLEGWNQHGVAQPMVGRAKRSIPSITVETLSKQSHSATTNPLGSPFLDLVPAIAEPQSPSAITRPSSIALPTKLILRLSDRRVHLYKGDREVISYPVAVGKPGWETPRGEFEVMQKIPDPVWRHPWNGQLVAPGPSNPLGRRWIGFARKGNNLYGFHGTIDESLIGQAVSHGCVRMRNADVEALFELIDVGTQVVVVP